MVADTKEDDAPCVEEEEECRRDEKFWRKRVTRVGAAVWITLEQSLTRVAWWMELLGGVGVW